MIGHMVLRKHVLPHGAADGSSSASILGLKVVGGKLLESGARGALIEKVKKGSIADLEGQLRPGGFYLSSLLYPVFFCFCFLIETSTGRVLNFVGIWIIE